MIKTVIKRNGNIEEFEAEKLNNWGIWAAKRLDPNIVNWSGCVMNVVSTLPEEVTTKQLQDALIKYCLDKDTYEHNLMAGRLYASSLPKELYSNRLYPHIKDLHKKMHDKGLIILANYTDEEYDEINDMLDHKLDLTYAHYSISQLINKVSIQDKIDNKKYESPQFIYMRVVMQTFNNYFESDRMEKIKNLYYLLSHRKINVPTPYFTNSLTKNPNVASCSVFTCEDTAESIGVMNSLTYMMTVSSAGLGVHFKTRSINDPVRGGTIRHMGKVPYYKGLVHSIKSSVQGGRGGSSTIFFPFFDPEIVRLLGLKNPLSTEANRLRQSDYTMSVNKWFMEKVAKRESIYLFSYLDAPEIYDKFYSDDSDGFGQMIEEFAKNNPNKVKEVSAMDIIKLCLSNSLETGRVYLHFVDEANRHTPYNETIYSSNLCLEINLPTKPFESYKDLYDLEKEDNGVVAFCNLAGIVVDNIESDEEYEKAAYYSLLMIDEGIENSNLPFPVLNKSIRDYRSAGVGILGLAHLMAKKGLSYTTQDGKNFMHELGETHAYHLYKAALKLGKERGNAPFIHKTKFVDGWLPIDTYNKNVDSLVTVGLNRDWEKLRNEIISNGGIRFTTVSTIPPSETSSISSESTTSIYPIRDFSLVKTNGDTTIRWVAPNSTKLKDNYEIVWDIDNKHIIEMYGIFQKFIDQGISGDLFIDRTKTNNVSMTKLIQETMWLSKYGVKSRYYINSKVEKDIDIGDVLNIEGIINVSNNDDSGDVGCGGGGCDL